MVVPGSGTRYRNCSTNDSASRTPATYIVAVEQGLVAAVGQQHLTHGQREGFLFLIIITIADGDFRRCRHRSAHGQASAPSAREYRSRLPACRRIGSCAAAEGASGATGVRRMSWRNALANASANVPATALTDDPAYACDARHCLGQGVFMKARIMRALCNRAGVISTVSPLTTPQTATAPLHCLTPGPVTGPMNGLMPLAR